MAIYDIPSFQSRKSPSSLLGPGHYVAVEADIWIVLYGMCGVLAAHLDGDQTLEADILWMY